jgi:hypothetical protein
LLSFTRDSGKDMW